MIIKCCIVALLIIFSISLIVALVLIMLTISDSIQARRYVKKKKSQIKKITILESILKSSQDIEEMLNAIAEKNTIKSEIRRNYI